MSEKHNKHKKIMALALAFAMVFGMMPMQAMTAQAVSWQQNERLPLRGYTVSFAEGNFPFAYEVSVGQQNVVFSQYVNVTFADSHYAFEGAAFVPPAEEFLQEAPEDEVLPAEPDETEGGQVENEPENEVYEPEYDKYEYDVYEPGYGEYENDEYEPEYGEYENDEVAPTYPTYPTHPTYPTYPSYPTDPVDPTYPTYPTDPVEPTDPTYPGYTVDPADPVYPTYPTYPAYPLYPSDLTDNEVETEDYDELPNSVALVWYLDGVRRADKGIFSTSEERFMYGFLVPVWTPGVPVRMELAFDEVTEADMGVWTLRAYSFGEYLESPYALFLQVGEIEAFESAVDTFDGTFYVYDSAGLANALANINPGESATITLGAIIIHNETIHIYGGRNITFNLAGQVLSVDAYATDAMRVEGSAVHVAGPGTFNLMTDGWIEIEDGAVPVSSGLVVDGGTVTLGPSANLNVGGDHGVRVNGENAVATVSSAGGSLSGARAVSGGSVIVQGIATSYNMGAWASDGGTVTVLNAIGGWIGAWASGEGSSITVQNNATGNHTGVRASDGGAVTVINATGGSYGAFAEEGGTVTVAANAGGVGRAGAGAIGAGSSITVGANATGNFGAFAHGGATVTVRANAVGNISMGAEAHDAGSSVTVGANAVGAMHGAWALRDATVTVGANAVGGTAGAGARAEEGSTVTIGGSVTGGSGAWAANSSEIIIRGAIDAANYIVIQGNVLTQGDYVLPTTRPGYLTYTDNASTVWVRGDGGDDGATLALNLSPITVNRISNTHAAVTFISNLAGTSFHQVDGTPPTAASLAASGQNQQNMVAGLNTINLTQLEAGQRTLYIVGENAELISNLLTITIHTTTPPAIQPDPDPMPDPDPDPTPDPDPDPTPDPTPQPTPDPTPEPEPTPEPMPQPEPTPIPQTTPQNGDNGTTQNGGNGGDGAAISGGGGRRGAANFNSNRPRDITITLRIGGGELRGVRYGNRTLEEDEDYSIDGNEITIKADFLATLEVGRRVITFVMSSGNSPNLTINIRGTRAANNNVPTEDAENNEDADDTEDNEDNDDAYDAEDNEDTYEEAAPAQDTE